MQCDARCHQIKNDIEVLNRQPTYQRMSATGVGRLHDDGARSSRAGVVHVIVVDAGSARRLSALSLLFPLLLLLLLLLLLRSH